MNPSLGASYLLMDRETDEYELATRAREGDREALAELVEQARLRLFSFAYAELRHYEDAQDAVAAALLQICRHIQDLREPARVRAWMHSILHHEVYGLRRGERTAIASLEAVPEPFADAQPLDLRLDLERALQHVPRDQARAIRLRYLDNLSVREISERTGRAEGTVTSWLHRGRRQLASHTEAYAPLTPSPTHTNGAQKPLRPAALIHSDLNAALVQSVTEAMRDEGYSPTVVVATDLQALPESRQDDEYLVLDETIRGRPALELFVHLRQNPLTRRVPICILCSEPSPFTAAAFFGLGVVRLIDKSDTGQVERLGEPITRNFEGPRTLHHSGLRPYRRAVRSVFTSRDEAAALGVTDVDTEHLLLALIRDDQSGASRLLEALRVTLDQVRAAIEPHLTHGPIDPTANMRMTPGGQRARDLAEAEALQLGHDYVGTEHQLLGLIRERKGVAAYVLTKLGIDLDHARQAIRMVPPGEPSTIVGAPR
jgi:RNA polymerase sigma factor (sigma-70 family)